MMDRRKFLRVSAGAAAFSSYLLSCSGNRKRKGAIIGASSSIGHLLRDRQFEAPSETIRKKIVIAGAGVTGLTAGYCLDKHGEKDFLILDLEQQTGGNARWGSNRVSSFPWGAHYVPIPNNDLTEYLSFLQECGVITGQDEKGLPVYNELHLCFDPQERLYINGRWQDGLVPSFGVPDAEAGQIARFLKMMDDFRQARGKDGLEAFAIPIDRSSKDESFASLDRLTMKEWMLAQGFTSSYLHWYANYCTRDDFGTEHQLCSAWMGIHYFASRKGKGANAEHQDVLTWPEGNGFLVKHLSNNIHDRIRTGCLVVRVEKKSEDQVLVSYYDTSDKKIKAIEAGACILAVPQFVAARLLQDGPRRELATRHLHYTPWMVANLTVNALEERAGAPPSWDNVVYESDSLGYVEATHELLGKNTGQRNLTYYLPLTHRPPADARREAQGKSLGDWSGLIMRDLKKIHPGIEKATEELNVLIWGHAMAQPLPGLIHGPVRGQLSASLGNIHFAHTDLAGASIFEEAFYQGWQAARKLLTKTSEHA